MKNLKTNKISFFCLFACLFLSGFSTVLYAETSAVHILDEMPVQHAGRVKPFQSFARESALTIIGSDSYRGISATELVWDWIAKPEDWNTRAMITVPSVLREEFGVMVVKGRISPEMILNHKPFQEKVQSAIARRRKREMLTQTEKKRIELSDRAALFQAVATGSTPGWIPNPDELQAGWLSLQGFSGESAGGFVARYPETKISKFMRAAAGLVEAWQKNSKGSETRSAARLFSQAQQELLDSRSVVLDRKALRVELTYNRLRAFRWAWKLYLGAAFLFALSMFLSSSASKLTEKAAVLFWGSGFLIHLAGFSMRCVIAGRPPVTNMYESLIWVSWTAVFFSMILFAVYRAFLIPFTSSLVAAFALVIAETFPAMMDPSISPLVPVLRSNLWLSIHVLTITMSYGAFALAWGLGHAVVIGCVREPANISKLKDISGFLYRALQIGVILLASGTVLGGVWANYSWGRFWGWDPKETWALIALLGYLVVIHGRFAGWLDTLDSAVGSVIAFAGVVMAWYGVNYVLAAGLHSYGFGGGGALYVVAAALADIAFIFILRAVYKKKEASLTQRTAV